MTTRKKDHLDQLIKEFVGGDPKRQAMLDEETVNFESAQLVYQLRTKAGLTQRQLAKKVGTTASVICRMEQADYDGSLAMLRRITAALNQRLELRAVPIQKASHGMAPAGRKKLAKV
jgi:ribosome-binding protein aMBF1 (putative translation factor)